MDAMPPTSESLDPEVSRRPSNIPDSDARPFDSPDSSRDIVRILMLEMRPAPECSILVLSADDDPHRMYFPFLLSESTE